MRLSALIRIGLLCLLLHLFHASYAQDSSRLNKALSLPDKLFGALDQKTASIESKLDHQTQKYLSKLLRQESKLRNKVYKKDSLLAKQLFEGVDEKYNQLKSGVQKIQGFQSLYMGHMDSLTTALSFLKQSNTLSSLSSNSEVQKALSQYKNLQSKFTSADAINSFIMQRQALLKEQLQKLGMIQMLNYYQKQAYYYRAQLQAYKDAFSEPSKMEQKLMDLALKVPQFKSFFQKNSMLSSLFALPGSGSTDPSIALQGLQTRAMVNQSITNRFGSNPITIQQLQGNVQAAQAQLSTLKDKITSFSSGYYGNGSSDMAMLDYRVNPQHTKSFLQRITLGTDFQSQKAGSNAFFDWLNIH